MLPPPLLHPFSTSQPFSIGIHSSGSGRTVCAFSSYASPRCPMMKQDASGKETNNNYNNHSSSSSSSNSNDNSTGSEQLTHLTSSGEVHMVHIPPPVSSTSSTASSFTGYTSSRAVADDAEEKEEEEERAGRAKTKAATARTAIARAHVLFSNAQPLALIQSASLKKGDVLSVARIAGIMASKKTSELIPLCHNIPLSGVEVNATLVRPPLPPHTGTGGPRDAERKESEDEGEEEGAYKADPQVGKFGAIAITAKVHTFGQTGVEMESLTAASAAALTVYDMCKGVDRGMRIDGLRVVLKEGGRSGTWSEPKN